MQIVINHLTKMQPGFICVAGIDMDDDEHVRPTLGRRLEDTMSKRHGGIFAIGDIVDLGNTVHVGTRPELEDFQFREDRAKNVGTMSDADFWKLLNDVAETCLEDVFGKHLEQRGNSYAVLEGKGSASLGCIIPKRRPLLYIDNWGKLCLSLENSDFTAQVKVNDLRLHKRDGTVHQRLANAAIERVNSKEKLVLSVGLARAFQAKNDTHRRHWLQINNIHFAGDPAWTTL